MLSFDLKSQDTCAYHISCCLFSALEEWRKRKMERARQRGVGKNGTTTA